MTNFKGRLFKGRLFKGRLFRGPEPVSVGGPGVPQRQHAPARRRRRNRDDDTLIFLLR